MKAITNRKAQGEKRTIVLKNIWKKNSGFSVSGRFDEKIQKSCLTNPYISCIEVMEIWSIGLEKVPTSAIQTLYGRFPLLWLSEALGQFALKMSLSKDSVEISLLYSTQKNINSTEYQDPNVPNASVNRLDYIYHNEKLTIPIFQAGDTFSEPSLLRKAFINFWVQTYTYIFTYTVYIQHTLDRRNTAPLEMYKTL